jgi:hypothetical protein
MLKKLERYVGLMTLDMIPEILYMPTQKKENAQISKKQKDFVF